MNFKQTNNDLITQIRLGGRGERKISKERQSKKERIRRNKEERGKDESRKRKKGERRREEGIEVVSPKGPRSGQGSRRGRAEVWRDEELRAG